MKPFSIPTLLACASLAVSAAACTWETKLPEDVTAIHVERGRELLVTDDAVLSSLSSNNSDGPLSFGRVMRRLPLGPSSIRAWMGGWSRRLKTEGDSARAAALDARVTCPWLRRAPENQCSASCETCTGDMLRLEDAPFRLIAVANRTDLSVMPDRVGEGGEGRLVFALTEGPADDEHSPPLPFTIIVEYAQAGPAVEWASRWHALGAASQDSFPGALAALAGRFVETGALAQLRTADAVTGALVLHEFHLSAGELVPANVRNTPSWASVSEGELRAFATEQSEAIENGMHVVPTSWLAPSSALQVAAPAYLASVPSHEALVRGTCGGCHGSTESGFQIDPLGRGDAKLSRFLLDPTRELDEAGRRTQWMQLQLARR